MLYSYFKGNNFSLESAHFELIKTQYIYFRLISLLYLGKFFLKEISLQFLISQFLSGGDLLYPKANDFTFFHCSMRQRRRKRTTSG